MRCFPRKIETNDTIPGTPLQTYSNNDRCPTDVPFLSGRLSRFYIAFQ